MSGITYTPALEVFLTHPHLVAKESEPGWTDLTCNISGESCISALNAFKHKGELVHVIPNADIPGCRTNCRVFAENLSKV